ncbi:MAG TPA: ABC transporter ATP-binding protein [Bacteroidota bacterium]|jgi:lipoprotein-releasing system ATP-binding protein
MPRKKKGEDIISVQGVTRTFVIGGGRDGKLFVLRGVSINVTKGEVIAIVGASGAGKSTLLHIIGTLDKPTAGKVLFEGQDVFALSDEEISKFRNQKIGFVFQFHHLLPEFTALENVAMPALISGKTMRDAEGHALQLLKLVGMNERADAKPPKLSGGEQQRLAVARAMMNNPSVILADEPSGNLDTANAQQLHDLIGSLSKEQDQTFIIVTHNEALAKRADRIIRLKDGVVQ